ncbi:putative protein of unknown function DUF423 [Magnetofaba australis IT-1]|uniref:DUF423 domain-containing protein n=1 Tax=Magnetofaba australis IT-1 TaxID=1434232 RepID=A0A1Y2K6C7_9PROT|nr:putative protein of unknown function DUF423 [Magnetofaba australis IT-1]
MAVGLGAWVHHGLREALVAAGRWESALSAVQYQLLHGIAAALLGLILARGGGSGAQLTGGWALLLGALLFSSTIFIKTLAPALAWVGVATPWGGTLIMLGWALVAWGAFKSP